MRLITKKRPVSDGQKRRRDKDATQQLLLSAAHHVFSERGYDAATTREIAERAGVSEALIQRYFHGKAGLLQSIVALVAAQEIESEHASMPLPDKLEDEIFQVFMHPFEHANRNSIIRVVVSRALVDKELGKFLGTVVHDRKLPILKTRLMHYQKKGDIAADVDIDAIASCLSGLCFSMGFMGPEVFEWDTDRLKKIAANIAKVMARGARSGSL